MGYGEVALRVQDLSLRGARRPAAAAILTALVEQVALIGPAATIRHDLRPWEESVVDPLAAQGLPEDLDAVARVLHGD